MANQQQQLLFKRRFSSCQHTALVWPTAQMPSPVWASQPFHTLYPFVPGSPPPPHPPRAPPTLAPFLRKKYHTALWRSACDIASSVALQSITVGSCSHTTQLQ
jgi:hypothetical protein